LAPQPAKAEIVESWIRWSAPRTVYIPQTGQSLDGYFLDTWRSWGADSLGYPVTPEITENGRIVQYFEFGRMEYWPEDPNGKYVQFGALGRELKPPTFFRSASLGEPVDAAARDLALEQRAWLPLTGREAQTPDSATWRYIPETQHAIQNEIKTYWEETGGASY